jgi:hypothetical protein
MTSRVSNKLQEQGRSIGLPDVATLREWLRDDPFFAKRTLETIFAYQTMEEQEAGETLRHNGKGFTSTDAQFLTSLAKHLHRKGDLSPKQTVWLHKKMPKYANQMWWTLWEQSAN